MQFTWLNKQGVESDKGFIVQSVARFTIQYREKSKVLSIDVESDYGSNNSPCEYVKRCSFQRWDNGTQIPIQKQTEIIENFKAAMRFQGIDVVVEE